MTISWLIVRVFISSTFRDMQAERDHLVRFVFPRLREQLLPLRIHLVDVDLRWGVTSEQNALEVCREIVDECRPRFLCILGGRYGWLPPGKDHSITSDEIHYGVLNRTMEDRGFAYFYFRNVAATAAMVETTQGEFREPQDSENEIKLAELKQAIIDASFDPFIYPAKWDSESRRLIDLKEFGDRVFSDLLASIRNDPVLQDRFLKDTFSYSDEFDEENIAMETFVEERCEHFVLGSREKVMNELLAHTVASGDNNYLCLTGVPGSGKSALLAYLYRHLSLNHQQSTILLCHFVGVSPGSTDVRRTLRRLCHELKITCSDITSDVPDEIEKLNVAFPNFLHQACAKKRVVIILDAVNQFDLMSHSFRLHWLPKDLPENARIIISSLEGPVLRELRRRFRKLPEIDLKPLSKTDGESIIDQFLGRYRKQFEPNQRFALLTKTDAGTPLYLLAALEELRTLGTYEEITRRICELPCTIHELFGWIFERLENDDVFRDAEGRKLGLEFVSRFALLLGASRHGLSQQELTDLLEPKIVNSVTSLGPESQGNLAALLHLLRPYLMHRGELIDFYHIQLKEVVGKRYLSDELVRLKAHNTIADYFEIRWREPNHRALDELPYQRTEAKDWEGAERILCDLEFIEFKCTLGMTFDLITDYRTILQILVEENKNNGSNDIVDTFSKNLKNISVFSEFVRCHSHIFKKWPHLVLIDAFNHSNSGPVALQAEEILGQVNERKRVWIQLVERPQFIINPAKVAILEGHVGVVTGVALASDGITAVSVGRDNTLRVWDIRTGKCIHILQEHTSTVKDVCLNSDGQFAISCDKDTILNVWDVKTGELQMRVTTGHTSPILAIAMTPDGSRAVTADKKNLKVWNLQTGLCECSISKSGCETSYINSLAIFSDGRNLVTGSSGVVESDWFYGTRFEEMIGEVMFYTLDPRNMSHLKRMGWLTYDIPPVVSIAVAAMSSGLRVVAALSSKTIPECKWMPFSGVYQYIPPSEWNIVRGDVIRWDIFGKHDCKEFEWNTPICLALTLDGTRAITGHKDATVRLWDVDTGQCLKVLYGHSACVRSVVLADDGYTGISGDDNGSICVWDTHGESRLIGTSPDWWPPKWRINTSTDIPKIQKQGFRIEIAGKDLIVYETTTGKVISQLDGHRGLVRDGVISPEGRYVISKSNDNTVRIWDLVSKRSLILDGIDANPFSIMASGRFALSGTEQGNLLLWDITTGKCVRTILGHSKAVNSVICSPDGRFVVSGGKDALIRVWDCITWTCINTLSGHTDPIVSIRFTPDGQFVISASMDRTVRIWEILTGCQLSVQYFDPPIDFIEDLLPTGHAILHNLLEQVHHCIIHGLSFNLPVCTALHYWCWDDMDFNKGHWDEALKVTCPTCGEEMIEPDAQKQKFKGSIGRVCVCNSCKNSFLLSDFHYELRPNEGSMVKRSANEPTGLHHPSRCPSENAKSWRHAYEGLAGPLAEDAAHQICLSEYKFCQECDPSLKSE